MYIYIYIYIYMYLYLYVIYINLPGWRRRVCRSPERAAARLTSTGYLSIYIYIRIFTYMYIYIYIYINLPGWKRRACRSPERAAARLTSTGASVRGSWRLRAAPHAATLAWADAPSCRRARPAVVTDTHFVGSWGSRVACPPAVSGWGSVWVGSTPQWSSFYGLTRYTYI